MIQITHQFHTQWIIPDFQVSDSETDDDDELDMDYNPFKIQRRV